MSRGERLALTAIVVIGAALRIIPIFYGLPFIFHPDETFLVTELGKFLGGLTHGSIAFGISTFHYPLTALYSLYFGIGAITGRIHSVADIQNAFLLDAPALHLIGRAMDAGLSVITLVLTFLLGREAYSSRVGMVAVLLTAFSLPEISGAHWLKQNAIVSLMVVWATLAILRASRPDGIAFRPLALGIVLGVVVATRIDLAVFLPLFVLAMAIGSDGVPNSPRLKALIARPVVVTLATALLVYSVVSFQLIEVLARHVMNQPAAFKTRETGASLLQFLAVGDLMVTLRHNAQFYLSRGLVGTSGIVLTVCVCAGIVRAAWLHRREDVILLALVALLSIQLLAFNVYGVHYLARFMPILLVLAAAAVVSLSTLAPSTFQPWWLAVLVAAVAVQPAYYSIRYVRYLVANVDTRVQARQWIYQNIPFGTPIAVEKFDELPRYLPPLNEAREYMVAKLDQIRADARGSGLAFEARLLAYPTDTYPITNVTLGHLWDSAALPLENNYDLARLKASGARYLVMTSYTSPLMHEEADVVGLLISPSALDKDAFARYDDFMRQLPAHATLAADFQPRSRAVTRQTDSPIDPIIRIYRLQ